ncbi:RNA polymerase sigma-70 factor, ECF subfamily [Catalinimonas alkaloidigena]|uniref:RNA polymerase sigma-70 factor, ECF subfamily n=2 Tax=Catalinimonas alkaloidigena TaxID=1075417 RepID=A0A1G9KNT1_9BACT|nr:RNA polymerase sigma-70 factor, ECF subfamily [Catalinimonas alkaloidigena]
MLRVKAGDLDPMSLLFERYHRPLLGFLFRMTGQRDVSEDLVQNVFYRMLKYRHTFTGKGEFRAWMYQMARNALADHAKQIRRAGYPKDVADVAEKLAGGPEADAALAQAQELDALQEALNALPDEYREVLVLSRFQELKYEEIARVLQTTEGAVKVRVHRALNKLRSLFLEIENGKAHNL